jgi:hypothetical protein
VLGCRLGGDAVLAGFADGRMFAAVPHTELPGYPLRIERPPAL